MPDHAGADPDSQDGTGREAEPDPALYFALNPDLAAAFQTGLIRSAAEHWHDAGRRETEAGARPLLLDEGQTERPSRDAERRDCTIAAGHYLAMNPDLAAVFGADEDAARRHWVEHGSLEGRVAAGDAPYRDRAPDLAAILARPFGVDLHLPADDFSPAGVAGRRLLAALREARIPVAPRPFVAQDDVPFLSRAEAARPGTFRVSLIAASPQTLRRLLRAYPAGRFDASMVIAFWPLAGLARHMPDYPSFGAIDEVWVPSAAGRDRLASVAPTPVRWLELPTATLPSRTRARALLGLPSDMFAVLLDATLVSDGQGGMTLATHVAPAIAAFRAAFGGDRSRRLIVRAGAGAMTQAQAAIAGCANAIVLGDQRQGGASLPLAACDAMVAADGVELDEADAIAGGRVVLAPAAGDLTAALGRAAAAAPQTGRAVPVARAGGRIRDILTGLGLDAPPPAFMRTLGGSRTASLPVPRRPEGRNWSPALPVLSILLDAGAASPGRLEQVASALAAQPHPFWELCIAGSHRLADRGRLAPDPRVRLAPTGREGTMAAAIARAAALATGTHVLIARSVAEAEAIAGALDAITTHLVAGPAADVLLAPGLPGGRDCSDRIEAGGAETRPVVFRRETFEAAGGLRARFDPAGEYDLLLALLASRARIACLPAAAAPLRDPEPPAAAEAGRLALQAHLAAVAGPLAYAGEGLRAGTYRRRTHLMRPAVLTVVHPQGFDLPAGTGLRSVTARSLLDWEGEDLSTEHVVFLDDRTVAAAPDAFTALLEFLVEDGIGAVGARVRHADGTLHHAGLSLAPDGGLDAPGHDAPDDAASGNALAWVVHNPECVGGGVLATRRSVLLQLGGFDGGLRAADGVTFDLLAADFCLRAAELGLRTTYTPFAVFDRSAAPPRAHAGAPARTAAETLFRQRWQSASRR